MSERYHTACVSQTGRLSNDEFTALMADVVDRGKGSSRALFLAATPVLVAFYDGQVQAGRVGARDVEPLIQRALAALYRVRASYASGTQPFRAWLLDIARASMVDYRRGRPGHAITPGLASRKEPRPESCRAQLPEAASTEGFRAVDGGAKSMKKIAGLV